ncbi:hypothetical protein WDW89_09915 [Deltaproteobacteria bacterium TL4]
MLKKFDWLRLSKNGTELLSTISLLTERPEVVDNDLELGSPPSALSVPCQRCGIYAPAPKKKYCPACLFIHQCSPRHHKRSHQAVFVWGVLNEIPWNLRKTDASAASSFLNCVLDDSHFVVALQQRQLKQWLQNFLLAHGLDVQGQLYVFPSIGNSLDIHMGDFLRIAIPQRLQQKSHNLQLFFYPNPYRYILEYLKGSAKRHFFEVSEFLNLLEMAELFRALLRPNEQQELYKLLMSSKTQQDSFYWGRFLGSVDLRVKDMLESWRMKQWPRHRIHLLYELFPYVEYFQIHSVDSLSDSVENE